jgi:hypothetical protein
MKTVLVLGGYGRCGSRLVSMLSTASASGQPPATGIQCIAAGRNPPTSLQNKIVVALDANDRSSLQSTLNQGVDFVVNLSGDLEKNGLAIAQTCLESGVHYVDMGAGQNYEAEFLKLNKQAAKKGVCLVTNAGASPVLSTILADHLFTEFERVTHIHVTYSPGNKSTGAYGSTFDTLKKLGREFRIKERGRWQQRFVWQQAEKVNFPNPVGHRRLFLNEAIELEFFPSRYGANTVTFRTGYELSLFNLGASWLAWRKRKKQGKRPEIYASILTKAAWWLRNFGNDKDALGVSMIGEIEGQEIGHVAYLVSRSESSLVILCAPIASLVKKWANHGIDKPGAFSGQDILSMDDVKLELSQHDVVLVRR